MSNNTTSPVKGNIEDFRIFESMPGISVLLKNDSPLFTIVAVTEEFTKLAGEDKEQLVGKGYFEVFPFAQKDANLSTEADLRASFEYVRTYRQCHKLTLQGYVRRSA